METIKLFFLAIALLLYPYRCLCQDITSDTTLANSLFEKGKAYQEISTYDSAIICYEKASELYAKHQYWKKYLTVETKHSACYQKQWQIRKAINTIHTALNKSLIYIDSSSLELADSYNLLGQNYFYLSIFDTALIYLKNTLAIRVKLLGSNHNDVANTYSTIGTIKQNLNEPDSALEYNFKALKIKKKLLGENHIHVAMIYGNIGITYQDKGKYHKALKYYFLALPILKNHFGEKHPYVAINYNNTGIVYAKLNDYDKALDYYFKSLEIKKEIFGEKHNDVAMTYNNIGIIYKDKCDYDFALKYFFKTNQIFKEIFGEKHLYTATCYNNIGIVYGNRSEYDLALEYHFKALHLKKELLGNNHSEVASSYNNIGVVYLNTGKYDLALKYFFKALRIQKDLYGEDHVKMASASVNIGFTYFKKQAYDSSLFYNNKALKIAEGVYNEDHSLIAKSHLNIGNIYFEKSAYKKALEHYNKSLQINTSVYGEKHKFLARAYCNIAELYKEKNDYEKALQYYQKAIASSMWNFHDTLNVNSVPVIKDYLSWEKLLQALQEKAEIYATHFGDIPNLEIALRHYQACDTLICKVRQSIASKADKLTLGKETSKIYDGAIGVCHHLIKSTTSEKASYYKKQAFYFSEKNKSSVLLEAISGAEAIKFAGIPDSLIEKEHNLQINIELFKKILAEQPDSMKEAKFKDKLFNTSRQYDALIASFEHEYPSYFELKYNFEPVTIENIQRKLDKKTAILSYFTGHTTTTVFTISKKNLNITTLPTIKDVNERIKAFRNALIFFNSSKFSKLYKEHAVTFYNHLIPTNIPNKIEHLIIIPDQELSLIPFEALLTKNAKTNAWNEQPYLIKKYSISYSYSANLYYKTFPKKQSTQIEHTTLNDWLAFAPVFNDAKTAGVTLKTRKLLQYLDHKIADSSRTRAMLIDGMYVNPLPATEKEVQNIFKYFNNKGKKALVLINQNANEAFLKSNEIKKYKYIHLATHGFVNTDKPELSGLLLAMDTAHTEDGILYMGEIYNLKLNAELTVLSACETGLGKIKKGEGLIGLTRALLYAGSKNIMVSLWKVSDNSTSQLMIDFYKTLLETKQNKHSFSIALKQAKLNMINEEKYAHPFFWSPFILIGQ